MPNECMNILGIMGKKEDVEAFVKFVTYPENNEIALFNSLMPMPEELGDTQSPVNLADKGKNKELISKYGADNWYDWKIDNWGTKWGDYEVTTSTFAESNTSDDWYITYFYTTAWAPGENELMNAIANQFPTLKAMLQYEEPGMAFAGETLVNNGKIVKQESWEIHHLADDITDVYWLQYGESE